MKPSFSKKMRYLLVLIVGFISLYFLSQPVSFVRTNPENPLAENGVLHLEEWDFEEAGVIRLDGYWKYVDGELLQVDEIINNPKAEIIDVPSFIKGRGMGTYYLEVKLPQNKADFPRILGIKTESIRMAHTLYINDQKISSSGTISTENQRGSAGNTPYAAYFEPKEDQLEILIHVENQTFVDMGIGESIYLGTSNDISLLDNLTFSIHIGLCMVLLLFSMYHLTLYILRGCGGGKFILFSAIYFFVLMVSILFGGDKILLQVYPDLPFTFAYKIKDLFGFGSVLFFILSMRELERKLISNWMVVTLVSPLLLYMVVIIFTPYPYYSLFIHLAWTIAIVILLVIISRLFYFVFKGISRIKRNELITLIIAFSFIILFLVLEVVDSALSLGYTHEYGMVGFLIFFIILLAIKMSNLMTSLEEVQKEANHNELAYLNLQIKPHFLYNSLSTIISLCYSNPHKAATLVQNMTIYLRLILENNQKGLMIPLEKEIKLIKAYVEIEKTRLPYLQVEFCIDEGVEKEYIPSLLIQPMVENAIRHGIFKKGKAGKVQVCIMKDETSISIKVEDDGIGIDRSTITHLLNHNQEDKGFGIRNIQNRLEKMHGAIFSIHSEVNRGTKVLIKWPIRKE
ncbi:sensor histidine kinase [Bacillus weihaiensis]|uniref:Histidine kinase domain-containing protein n=1 Tax=Bacillus weihaiensis TaxID=1547283 RepID=A0A1L3MTK5_9BACI|nr:histidine kinase [Bacillus weihaiensis]APH05634.1 hypothetical protein A9C19_13230 [Bacillus weihaiensis]